MRHFDRLYWAVIVVAIAAGALAWSSFGQILVLFGVLLAALAPLRRDRAAFWPLAAGLLVFLAAYVASAPTNCRTGAIATAEGHQTPSRFCESLIGIDYDRAGSADPSSLPAFAGSLGAGIVAAAVTRTIHSRRVRRAAPPEAPPTPRPDEAEPAGFVDPNASLARQRKRGRRR